MPRSFTLLFAVLATASSLSAQAPTRLTAAEFGALVERLSESGGYFDTDNLVSNEDSYLHAITGLERHGVRGGAYLGVGPDQNFSYIAAIRPRIAFIIDIRRDNLLEQLWFKALFHPARNRVEFLALLFGKAAPVDTAGWGARDLETLLGYLTRAPPDSVAAARARRLVRARAAGFGISVSAGDLSTIERFHRTFIAEGPELKLTTFGRPERPDYPTYRRLLLETDLTGRRASYLARESDFQFVKSLAERNLIVPVVGDLAGPTAVAAIGRYLAEHRERVAAFYTSNVEQYLFRGRTFGRFARNVAALPHDQRSVIIRSYFPYGQPHPQAVPGYLSVQLLQTFDAFLAVQRAGGFRSYGELVTRDLLPPR
ncbi:MAG: hypothetical protein HYW52_05320 [Gemmatimonadetes bacterium]|nr:hypothetical protein [Gemmatimonadota bacterium]